MSDYLRHLVNNLGTIILALLLSFVVWIAATLQADPFVTQEFPNVPVEVVNQPPNTVIFEEIDDRVDVVVRAPQSIVQELTLANFQATMNLDQVDPSVQATVPVSVTCDIEAVRIESVEPTLQPVHLEVVETITLPVELEVMGEPATGYRMVRPVIVPDQVEIRGPAPLLSDVISVTATIGVEGVKDSVVERVAVTPVGSGGELVAGVEWTPDRVEVRVGVQRRVGFKPDVEVVPDLRGQPASGYRLGSVSVDPSTVTLQGPSSILNTLPGFVETLPISVTGAVENLTVRSLLTVPNSVVVVDARYVTVQVEILPIQSSRPISDVVEIEGVRPDWRVTPSPEVVDLILQGPDAILAELTSEDVQVTVNVSGLSLGTHRVTPEVFAPRDVTVVSIIPETVEVVIEPRATPTPAGIPAPSPVITP